MILRDVNTSFFGNTQFNDKHTCLRTTFDKPLFVCTAGWMTLKYCVVPTSGLVVSRSIMFVWMQHWTGGGPEVTLAARQSVKTV